MEPATLEHLRDITQYLEYEEMLCNLPREEIGRSAAQFMLVRYRALVDFVTFDYHTRPSPTSLRERKLRWQIIAIPLITRNTLTAFERAEREEIAMEERRSITSALVSNSIEEAWLNEEGDQLTAWVTRWKQIVAYYLQRYEYWDRFHGPRSRMEDIDPNSDDIAVRICEWAGVAVLSLGPAENCWGTIARLLTIPELVALNTVSKVMIMELTGPNRPPDWYNVVSRLPLPLSDGVLVEREGRANAVSVLYPVVDIASLGVDEKECPICNLEYGEGAGACTPLATTCCPPSKLGSICLLRWFCEENRPGCPFCRSNLEGRIALM